MEKRSSARRSWFLACALAVTALVLAIEAVRTKSACYDEPKHIATGAYACVDGKFLGDDNAPIVALFGWPARFHHWQLPRAPTELTTTGKRLGLYEAGVEMLADGTNATGVADTLFWPRMTSVALFVLLLLAVALEGHARGEAAGMLVALALVGLSPVLLSHAGIVSADLPLALAAVLVASGLRRYQTRATAARAVALGLVLGLALVTKLTGVVLVLGVALWLSPRLVDPHTRAITARHAAISAIAFVLVVGLSTRFDFSFFVRQWQLVSHYGDAHRTDFYRGTLGARALGFYPFVLLLKLEPAFFVALGTLALARFQERSRLRGALPTLFLALLVFAATMASGYRQGFRFLLPMWPLLALAASHAFSPANLRSRWLAAAIVVTSTITAFGARPNFLTYWNPLARGQGDAWFVDSNHDWGQDLTTLARWQSTRSDVKLYGALYTIVPPADYGIRYSNLFDDPSTLARFDATQTNYIVFSVSLLRMIAADTQQPLGTLARALLSERWDLDFGGSIRGYELTAARLERLLAFK